MLSPSLQRIFGNKRTLSSHPHDVLHIIDDAHQAKGHHQSEGCGGNWAGIFGKPEKETCLHLECKERHVGGRGKNEDHSDGSADDTDNEGGNHRHLVAANGGLLMLMDVLDGIQSLGETGRPRDSCFFTASSEVSVMAEISLML